MFSIKPEHIENTLLVGGSTRIPAVQRLAKELMGKLSVEVKNPDELVALGAALQAAICNGELAEVLLIDVTTLTLSIDTFGDLMRAIIPRQSSIPRTQAEIFSTAEDNQKGVTIVVCQGERRTTPENKVLGTFELLGIRPAKRGVPKIQVTFELDVNGLLTVIALDKGTNKRQKIKITGSSNLSSKEIDNIIEEAGRYQSDDNTKVSALSITQQTQNTMDLASQVVESKINPLDIKVTKEVKNTIKELEIMLEVVLRTKLLESNSLEKFVEVIECNETRLTEILFQISEESLITIFAEVKESDGDIEDY